MPKEVKKVALLTAGGLAPCLSSAVGALIERYSLVAPQIELICYMDGYMGLLQGRSIAITPDMREHCYRLHRMGGSPIGNSRVKLTNVKDCVKRGLVQEGEDPQKKAADQLVADGVDVLHTIGGDDTNTAAADLAAFLANNNYALTVVGLPKTIDNDVYPIKQTLGAWTAADEGAHYFSNVVSEHTANPRMLIVHEVMGRACGWLTAWTARQYRNHVMTHANFLGLRKDVSQKARDVHAVYVPELDIDIQAEAARLKKNMDDVDCVNIFIAEGAGAEAIVAEMESKGQEIPRDAFGHVKLDAINPGQWFAKQFAEMIQAEKVLVQKSGYYARSAPAGTDDQRLIQSCADTAVECALRGIPGVIGQDEDQDNRLRAIEFDRIKGGKPLDVDQPWFVQMLAEIGQPLVKSKTPAAH